MNPEHKEIIEEIQASSEALRRTVEEIPADLLDQRPQPGEWSVLETLVHIRNVAMLAYGLRLRRLLFEDEPAFPDYDEERLPPSVTRPGLPAAEILDMIVADHQNTARLLRALGDGEWERQGHHPISGALTIKFLAQRLAAHANEHIAQIADTYQALTSTAG